MIKKYIEKFKIMAVAFFAMSIIFSTEAVFAAEGDMHIMPVSSEIGADTNFDIEVYLDTNGKNLGAFNIYLDFDATNITINT